MPAYFVLVFWLVLDWLSYLLLFGAIRKELDMADIPIWFGSGMGMGLAIGLCVFLLSYGIVSLIHIFRMGAE